MNSVFLPPGSNPFQLPPLPQSYYLPSPAKEDLDKNISLTPQKPTRRHEYSLPPEVYTPEHYSICEETTSTKPPLPQPQSGTKDLALDLQKYFNDVESWTSSQFCEEWSQGSKNDFSSINSTTNEMSKSRIPLSSTQRSSGSMQHKTKAVPAVRLKTSFASDRNVSNMDTQRSTNIAMRLNRFRYGDPKPSQERKKERVKLPTPSAPSGRKVSAHTSPSSVRKPGTSAASRSILGTQKKVSTPRDLPPKKDGADSARPLLSSFNSRSSKLEEYDEVPSEDMKSPSEAETSISRLNTKLEKLLQESSSVISSPEPLSSRVSAATPSDVSTSYEFKVSTLESTDLRLSHDTTFERKPIPEVTRRKFAGFDSPLKKHWRDENVPPRSPAKVRQEDDILHQWRLRRKLEAARDDVAKSETKPSHTWTSPRKSFFASQAEKPFITDEKRQSRSPVRESPRICGTFQAQTDPEYPTPHKPSCKCQFDLPQPRGSHPESSNGGDSTPPDMSAPKTGCKITYSPTRKMKSVGISVVPMKSMETQTTRSLLLSDEDSTPSEERKDHKSNALPHTSTPASSVSFHRVKIVQADLDGSPVNSKGSPKQQLLSPLSTKTDATTTWSSTDQNRVQENKEDEKSRSPVSSVKTSDQRFEDDSEFCSPTADVVRQVVGSRLFNSSQTPISTSRIARLQQKKKQRIQETDEISDQLSSSYTSTLRVTEIQELDKSSVSEESERTGNGSKSSETALKTVNDTADQPEAPTESNIAISASSIDETKSNEQESDFDPSEMFDQLLGDIEDDPGDFTNDPVLQTLRNQRDQFLAQFRAIEEEIEGFNEETED